MVVLTKKQHKPADAAQQISEKAAMQLTDLNTALRNLNFDQDQARTERERLLSEQAQRADHLKTLDQNVTILDTKHHAALKYAEVAQSTVGEQDAIKQASDIQIQLDQARAILADRQKEYSAADETATARFAEIDSNLKQWSDEIAAAHTRIKEIEQVRDQAHKELGEKTYASEMDAYNELQARIDTAKQELAQLQIERHQAIAASAEKLKPWHNLRLQIIGLDPHDDATTRVISACLEYLSILDKSRWELRDSLGVESVSMLFTWWQLLKVDEPVGYSSFKSRQGQEALQVHVAHLTQVLKEYQAAQQGR